MFTKRIAAAVAGVTLASSALITPAAYASSPLVSEVASDTLTNDAAENYVSGRTSDGRECLIPASSLGSAVPGPGSGLGSAALGSAALGSAAPSSQVDAGDGVTEAASSADGSSALVEGVACHPVSGSSLLAPLAGSALIAGAASSVLGGGSSSGSSLLNMDKCLQETERTEEKVVGTRIVVKDVTREGDWPVGDIKGPEGWTFTKPEGEGKTVSAVAPEGTEVGEYPATIQHFGYNKNQVAENVVFPVVEEEVKESRSWTELDVISCAVPAALLGLIPGVTSGGQQGEQPGGPRGEVLDNSVANVDHKVAAQQQAVNAPAAGATKTTAEVTPEHSAQETQLAGNGIGGTLVGLAVALLATLAGAGVLLKRRSN